MLNVFINASFLIHWAVYATRWRRLVSLLPDLLRHAEPLVKYWTENDNEKHRREFEYENNLLQVTAKQNRLMSIGLFSIFGLVLILGGILSFLGQPASAMDLIKLIISLAGAAFGGYGWAMGRRRVTEDKNE